MTRPTLLVNAVELLRQPGTRRPIEAAVALAELDIDDDRLDGDVAVIVDVTSTIDDVIVDGSLEVAWHDTCRRCLRPIDGTVRVDVDERYQQAPGPTDDAFPIDNGQINLAPMVREEVLLAVSMAPLCRPDCPGLCPICGTDLQTGTCDCTTVERDERWAILDQLRLD